MISLHGTDKKFNRKCYKIISKTHQLLEMAQTDMGTKPEITKAMASQSFDQITEAKAEAGKLRPPNLGLHTHVW